MTAGDPPAPPPPESFPIRAARSSDVPVLVRQYLAQSEGERRFYHPFPFRPGSARLILLGMAVSGRWARGPLARVPWLSYRLLVAEVAGGGIAGHTYYRVQRRRGGPHRAVVGIGVATDFQGRGIGSRLLEALAVEARRSRLDQLTATVHPGNEPSRRLFLRSGYLPAPVGPAAPRPGGAVPELPFTKDLRS